MSKQVWRHPRTWGFVLVAGAMAFVMTFSYIGAFVDLRGNMHNMPLVLVTMRTPAPRWARGASI